MPALFSDFIYSDVIFRTLPQVFSDIACAINEREEAVNNASGGVIPSLWLLPNLTGKSYPSPSDFVGYDMSFNFFGSYKNNAQAYADFFISEAVGRIEYLAGVTPGYVGIDHIPGARYSQKAHYTRGDWTGWSSASQFLSEIGYPGGWEADRRTDNPTIWYQLREAVRALRWYAIRVPLHTSVIENADFYYTQRVELGSSNPATIAGYVNTLWRELLTGLANGGTTFTLFPYIGYLWVNVLGWGIAHPKPTGTAWTFGAYIFRRFTQKLGYIELFDGEVVSPWETNWTVTNPKSLSIAASTPVNTVTIANNLGDSIQVGPGAGNESGPFTHSNADAPPLGTPFTVEFTISDPPSLPPTQPYQTDAYDVGQNAFSYHTGGMLTLGNTMTISEWKCDAYPALSYV